MSHLDHQVSLHRRHRDVLAESRRDSSNVESELAGLSPLRRSSQGISRSKYHDENGNRSPRVGDRCRISIAHGRQLERKGQQSFPFHLSLTVTTTIHCSGTGERR
eukprot:768254-Hanusia_phi.AAC.3